jgi:hypothetical protein
MPHLKIHYSNSENPWLEVWLTKFLIRNPVNIQTRQELLLSTLRNQAEADLSKIYPREIIASLFYPECILELDLEDLGNLETRLDCLGYPKDMTRYELVSFIMRYSDTSISCVHNTLKTVGKSKIRAIRLQFTKWNCPVYYHPTDSTRDFWTLQGLTGV